MPNTSCTHCSKPLTITDAEAEALISLAAYCSTSVGITCDDCIGEMIARAEDRAEGL